MNHDSKLYGSLVKEAKYEYHYIFNSKRGYPSDIKYKYKYQHLLLKAYTVTIEQSVKNNITNS